MLAMGYNFWTEWEANEKVYFDGVNRLIYVYPHVTELDIREDVWSAAVRWLAMLNRGNDRFLEPMERSGLEDTPIGVTGDNYFLINNWKLLIDFSSVRVSGVLFSRDFDSAYYTYDLNIQYAAEVSSIVNTVVSTGDSVITGDIDEVAQKVWEYINRSLTQSALTEQDKLDIANTVLDTDGGCPL